MKSSKTDLILLPINLVMLFALMVMIWGISGVIVFAETATGLYLINLFNFCIRGAYGLDILANLAKAPALAVKLWQVMSGMLLRSLNIEVTEQA